MTEDPLAITRRAHRRPLALIVGSADVALWHVKGAERLSRLLREVGIAGNEIAQVTDQAELSAWRSRVDPDRPVVLVNGNYLFEPRTLRPLVRADDNLLLVDRRDDHDAGDAVESRLAAARVSAARVGPVARAMLEDRSPASLNDFPGAVTVGVEQLGGHDARLRRGGVPLLEWLAPERVDELETKLYGNAYKGVTDVITKWVWPRPAALLVRACARLGLTPNAVTTVSLILVLTAGWMFFQGWFWPGLLAAWIMTLLDTVDGKLARVTVQSSRIGDIFDHGIDLVHPPFWYLAWALGLEQIRLLQGIDSAELALLIFVPYVAGRLIELAFGLLCGGSLFTFKPFDSWFRLVAARRNPNLIMLTLALAAGHPEAGVVGVIGWSLLSTLIQAVRLADGLRARRVARRPLVSWLGREPCWRRHPVSYRTFSTTRGAYARR